MKAAEAVEEKKRKEKKKEKVKDERLREVKFYVQSEWGCATIRKLRPHYMLTPYYSCYYHHDHRDHDHDHHPSQSCENVGNKYPFIQCAAFLFYFQINKHTVRTGTESCIRNYLILTTTVVGRSDLRIVIAIRNEDKRQQGTSRG